MKKHIEDILEKIPANVCYQRMAFLQCDVIVSSQCTKKSACITSLVTVFAVDFPVRVHVCAQFLSPLACLFALLASQLTIIMLCLNMQPQMLVSWNFNAAYGAGRHRQCKFSLNNYCQQFLISNMTIFLYQNETSRSVEWPISPFPGPQNGTQNARRIVDTKGKIEERCKVGPWWLGCSWNCRRIFFRLHYYSTALSNCRVAVQCKSSSKFALQLLTSLSCFLQFL